MQATRRAAHRLVSQSLLRSTAARTPLSSAAASQRTVPTTALGTTASDVVTLPRSRRWPSPPPAISSRIVPVGFAGALSFSMTLVTVAEAKEPPSPERIPKDVVLYQYEACPFCNKVKAYLDYHDIPYKVVEVNPISKKEIKWSDYKKVPILVVDGEQLVNSSDIVKNLDERLHPEHAVIDEEEAKWLRWVDDHLVHMLSPNIYRTTSEALESFDYIAKHGNFSFTERLTVKYAGAAIMYMVSKKLKKKYNITDERASLYEAAQTWTAALGGRDFLGGAKPNLADLAVFGVLRPIRYLSAGKDMVENTNINDWYRRMETAVGESSRISM
ncbi:prostaglandin E synthase 2-like [Zingiber officinale]|uniref:prostaglandin E synthase 2-like n=1 Tax=Zingiber officinale TaxID=94328 RepID=UPI001C4D9481|nr:prostaglandin E synthase 2-like [Zingiber officinale]